MHFYVFLIQIPLLYHRLNYPLRLIHCQLQKVNLLEDHFHTLQHTGNCELLGYKNQMHENIFLLLQYYFLQHEMMPLRQEYLFPLHEIRFLLLVSLFLLHVISLLLRVSYFLLHENPPPDAVVLDPSA